MITLTPVVEYKPLREESFPDLGVPGDCVRAFQMEVTRDFSGKTEGPDAIHMFGVRADGACHATQEGTDKWEVWPSAADAVFYLMGLPPVGSTMRWLDEEEAKAARAVKTAATRAANKAKKVTT